MEGRHEGAGPRERAGRSRAPALTVLAVALGLTACEVTNPGPVEDRFLDDQTARQGIINGIKRSYSDALAGGCDEAIARDAGALTREIFPSGNPGNCGVLVQEGIGHLEDDLSDGEWAAAQEARWVAEDAIRRFQETMEGSEFSSSPFVAEAMVWAGFANKFMGENFCEAVIDGGAPQPGSVYFERAEQFFTDALGVAQAAGATDLEDAAYAGRASARVGLQDWAGAVADAGNVPDGFSFQAEFFGVSQEQYNGLRWAVASEPYRTISVWNTPYEQYYAETGDPRVPWELDPSFEFGDLARFDMQVPFRVQMKYPTTDAPIDLADSREMDLIRAEAMLMDGDWQGAMQIVNQLRADVGVDPWQVSNLEDAWTAFRFERGIELWLEARRMWDFRRWEEAGVPGEYQPLEDHNNPDTFLEADRDLCYPIPEDEQNTNPNVP